MPSLDSSVDVTGLLDRSGLDSAGYKSFPAEQDSPAQPAPVEESRAPAAQPTQRARGPRPPVMQAAARLLDQAVAPGRGARSGADWNALPAGRCLALTGVRGGCGASTILANAAAALAGYGERVAVADEAPSLLPFYFGGQSFRSVASFAPHRESGAGPVHLVTGEAGEGAGDWLLKGLTEFHNDADRILVNCRSGLSSEANAWTSRAAAAVALLTPDPTSLLHLPGALERMRGSGAENSSSAHPLLLLNQFEESNSLHAEIRSELSRRFGELLLPFVIERDDAFPRCLAAGATVVELEPQSRAGRGIRTLVEWLRNYKFEPES